VPANRSPKCRISQTATAATRVAGFEMPREELDVAEVAAQQPTPRVLGQRAADRASRMVEGELEPEASSPCSDRPRRRFGRVMSPTISVAMSGGEACSSTATSSRRHRGGLEVRQPASTRRGAARTSARLGCRPWGRRPLGPVDTVRVTDSGLSGNGSTGTAGLRGRADDHAGSGD
jgi:hypothetical protein